jgi:SH3-like domain-containing protein
MRSFTTAWLFGVILLASGFAVARDEAHAQSGTLQAPAAHPQAESAPRPPSAAPRQPVHQLGSSGHGAPAATPPATAKSPAVKPPAGKPPVVKPHGASHAEKPPTQKPPAHAGKPAAPAEPAAATPIVVPPASGKGPEGEKEGHAAARLPRFAALRSDEVNLRAGPGSRYPIEWVYRRRDLPVEIEREFEVWRLVRDMDGVRGWVHQATLTGRRNFIVKDHDATLRDSAKDIASAVAILKTGVVGRIRSCEAASDWCQVQAAGYRGYLRREQIWGLLPGEAINP